MRHLAPRCVQDRASAQLWRMLQSWQLHGLCEEALRTYELGRAVRMQTMTRVEMVSSDAGSP